VAPSRGVKASDEVSILAYSTGLQGFEWKWKYTKGNISSLSGEQNDLRYFQISTLVLPVFSGGPLLDASGNVVGIVVAKSSEETGAVPQNVNYAAKSSLLLNLVEAVPGLVERMPEAKPAKGNADEIVEDAKQGVVLVVCY
jgi:S1-C subfamily serine protease